jgi:tetratricopeptide (TPR) repeat protein
MPGVGKSSLAVHAAHKVKHLYPDGHINVNLDSSEGDIRSPFDALGDVLLAMEVSGLQMPTTLDGRASVYRSLMSSRRALVLLDNARDESHVRPFLLSANKSALIVTSRRPLLALTGVTVVHLPTMKAQEALDLFEQMIGATPIAREMESAKRILHLCGHLPLAIRVAAGRLIRTGQQDHGTLAEYANQLANEQRRLAELKLGDLEVRASFEVSYQELSSTDAYLFRLLSLLKGPAIERGIAGALIASNQDAAQDTLDHLAELHLIERVDQRRYQFHDLIRLFSKERFDQEESVASQSAARSQFTNWYSGISVTVFRWLHSTPSPETSEHLAFKLEDVLEEARRNPRLDAAAWFEVEYENLMTAINYAVECKALDTLFPLILNLREFFTTHALWFEWERSETQLLRLAREVDDLHREGAALAGLGRVYTMQGRWEEAIRMLETSLQFCRSVGFNDGEADVLTSLGNVYLRQSRWDDAIQAHESSVAIYRELGDRNGEAVVLANLAPIYLDQDRLEDALSAYRASLKLFEDVGDDHGKARSLTGLGNVYLRQGHPDEAISNYLQSLELSTALGNQYGVTNTQANLARALGEVDRDDEALEMLVTTTEMYRLMGDPQGEGKGYLNLGTLYSKHGEFDQAVEAYQNGIARLHDLGDRFGEAMGWINLGTAYQETGDIDDAIQAFEVAVPLLEALGDTHASGENLVTLANLHLGNHDPDRAMPLFQAALSKYRHASAEHAELSEWLEAIAEPKAEGMAKPCDNQ